MLNLIEWDKPLLVNGIEFENSKAAYEHFKDSTEEITIELNMIKGNIKMGLDEESSEEPKEEEIDETLYRIYVREYLTKSNNFNISWNEGNPMPMREMVGMKVGETKKMYKFDLFGKPRPTGRCMMCGKKLTHPVSLLYGVGPECGKHFHINPLNSEEELEASYQSLKNSMADIEWEGWIPKSAIIEMEVEGNV